MQLRRRSQVAVICFVCSLASGQQPGRRFAFVEAHGPLARANQLFALSENLLADKLTAKLIGEPGFALIDRASVDTLIKEQNFQNSDRSSTDTAARIGKLLGVSQIGFVNVTDLGYTEHDERTWNKIRTMGTTSIGANVRVIDVETGAIIVEPSSKFQDTVLMRETIPQGPFVPRPIVKLSGDPEEIHRNEWTKGSDKIVSELIPQLMASLEHAPGPKATPAMVAGIANGSVFINHGKQQELLKEASFKSLGK
jgi:hypothetical protein